MLLPSLAELIVTSGPVCAIALFKSKASEGTLILSFVCSKSPFDIVSLYTA
jgi:hypothetical protein